MCLLLSVWLCNNDNVIVTAFSQPRGFREITSTPTKLSSLVENSESKELFFDATSMGPNRNRIITTPSTHRYRYSNAIMMEEEKETKFSSSNISPKQKESDWKEKLTKLSNIASILCVLDCTILPIVSIALPLLGGGLSLLDTSTSVAGTCHTGVIESISHSVALYFVLPLGILTTILNQITMRSSKQTSNFFLSKIVPKLPFLGLSLIYLSNAPASHLDLLLSPSFVHALHCGTTLHRVVNLSGCTILLGSNYYLKKDQRCAFRGGNIDSTSLLCTLGCCLPQDNNGRQQLQDATFFTWKQ